MKKSRFATLVICTLSLSRLLYAQQTPSDSFRLSEPHHQSHFSPLDNPYHGFRVWDKDYLIAYAMDGTFDASPSKPAVVLYDRDGRTAREAIVWFKDAASTGVDDASLTKSGKLVVSGGTTSPAGVIANFIAEIDDTGHISRVIRTTPFLPIYICAAEDGTVWSYGIDRDGGGKGVKSSLRLRQYSFDKGQLRAMLDVTSLNSLGWTLDRGVYPGQISLRCTPQKVGIYNGHSNEWVEFDIPTNTLKVSKVEPLPPPKELRITGFALAESGDVFVSMHDRASQPPRSGLFRLSFVGSDVGKWVPVKDTVGPYLHGARVGQLLGVDGTDLVYTSDLDGGAHWSKFTK